MTILIALIQKTKQTCNVLNNEIAACTRCTRLVEYCQKIGRIKRRAYLDWDYWAKPVPDSVILKRDCSFLALLPELMVPTALAARLPVTAPDISFITSCTKRDLHPNQQRYTKTTA